MRSLGIHLRALSLDNVKIPINKTRLKIAVLKWHLRSPSGQWVKSVMTYEFSTDLIRNVKLKKKIALFMRYTSDTFAILNVLSYDKNKFKLIYSYGLHDSIINSLRLWHLWWQRSGSTLLQVMACCLMAPSHYLNQCWLLINEVLWYASVGNFTISAQDTESYTEFWKSYL